MIDLHSHILPGLDDGPRDIEGSLDLAREAASQGTRTIVATPHIRDDHPFPLDAIESGVEELNGTLSAEGIDLEVVAGGEVSISMIPDLDEESLRSICLGSSPYMLVESPYTQAQEFLEHVIFHLQARGFRPLLAHPERSPSFLSDWARLERLVGREVLCSVTAMSMEGRFGQTVQRFTARMFAAGLVHDVASDAHDSRRRAPTLLEGFQVLDRDLPGLHDQAKWFTRDAPAAVLAGEELPPGPPRVMPRRGKLRRLVGGRQGPTSGSEQPAPGR